MRMRNMDLIAGVAGVAFLLAPVFAAAQAPAAPPAIAAVAETAAGPGDANSPALLIDPAGAGSSRILAASEGDGITVWGLDGRRQAAVPAGRPVALDLRHAALGRDLGKAVVAVVDEEGFKLRLFEADARTGALAELTAREIPIGYAGVGVCLYRSALDDSLYAFVLGEAGEAAQWRIVDAGGKLDANPVRTLRLASEAGQCVADDASGDLYVSEVAVGVWRFDAEPEAEIKPEIIDIVKFGHIEEEAGGLALYDGGAGARYLVASNLSANTFNLYDRGKDHAYAGAFAIGGAPGDADRVDASEGLAASTLQLGPAFPGGLLVAVDDADDTGPKNLKLASLADVVRAAGLPAGIAQDPRLSRPSKLAVVMPDVETEPVLHDGDAADDPAIWVDPADPAASLVIGTDKKGGLDLYDLSGKRLQHAPVGRVNNVDLRDGFKLGGRTVSLVAGGNRTDKTITLFMLDPATRRLVDVSDGPQATGLDDPYGSCMHHDPKTKKTYVLINDSDGRLRQWELIATPAGKVRTRLVREFKLATQPEGCVADDATGALYVGEEGAALWRYGASPKAGDKRRAVVMAKDNPALKTDLEGVGIYDLGGGRGYIVLSSQGNNSYAVFSREGDNAYIGSFAVVANPAKSIDGVSETDGLEVTSRPLGPAFPHGAFIAQDGRNVGPPQYQNFKIVPWERIAEKLKLESR